MLQSIFDDIKREFDYGHMINRLIIINCAFWLLISVVWLVTTLANGWETPGFYTDFVHFFSASTSLQHTLLHIWTPLTYMFTHEGFFHLFWNMIILFWFGRIFGDLLGDRRVLPVYLLGGLAGAVFYWLLMPFAPGEADRFMIGASGAVLCILVAAGATAPDYVIRLFLLGNVKLKWIVAAVCLINILGMGVLDNIGGTFGHLGGITMGFLYVNQLHNGRDLAEPINRWIDKISNFFRGIGEKRTAKNRPGPKVAYRNKNAQRNAGKSQPTRNSVSHQEQLDTILDKIKDRGYESLSKEEKAFLFNASSKK